MRFHPIGLIGVRDGAHERILLYGDYEGIEQQLTGMI